MGDNRISVSGGGVTNKYTAVAGKLSWMVDSRNAYVTGPTLTGRIAPIASFWHFEEAQRWAQERNNAAETAARKETP